MRVLVTGAAGMLGRDVVLAGRRSGHDVVALAHAELDVTDGDAVAHAVAGASPDAVVNCAAWTDVDGAESNPDAAHAVNAGGARAVAAAAERAEASLVHVSTDYVFDGLADRPYAESDPPAPRSVYGESKLAGERAVAETAARHAIVRSSWLFGAGGRNFVETMLGLAAERDELDVVVDQVGSPTWTGHLAAALVGLAEDSAEGVFHVAGAGACSWHAFAVEILRQSGLDRRVRTITSDQLDRPAPRPPYSVLRTERRDAPVLPPWQEGLSGYLAERAARAGSVPA
jgi:dTDP-4-dehydrorhamnose reductase